MPVETPTGFALGLTRPEDAIAAFQARGLLQPSFRWQDVFNDEHSRAFAVAGVSRLDVLKVFQDELELTITEGRSLADFARRIRPQLAAKGFWGDVEVTDPQTGETRITTFDDARLRTIFDVNMRQSQAAGRWARIERTKKTLPFVMYRTMRDERVRASHRPWDGVVLPVDDPWWNTHYPPCGWRCRCRAFALDQKDIDRRRREGEPIKTEAPPMQLVTYVNPRTGEVIPVPLGIDPGFGYNPGKARDGQLYEQLLRKAVAASPLAGAVAVAQATIDHGAMVAQATSEFGAWIDQVLALAKPRGDTRLVGAITPPVLRALQTIDIAPATAAISLRDREVVSALNGSGAGHQSAPLDLVRRLPDLLTRTRAVLREADSADTLLYVVDPLRADGWVLVVEVERRRVVPNASIAGNLVRAATLVDPVNLRDGSHYQLLWGSL